MARSSRAPLFLLLALAGFTLACGACDRLPTESEPVPSGPPRRAITFVDWTRSGYSTPEARASLDELADTGANTVVFVVTAYQLTARSSGVGSHFPLTPDDLAVLEARAHAGNLGLACALKLHVDVLDGSWRGLIEPERPDVWFETYTDFATFWAGFAETWGFEELAFGTELATLSAAHEAEWRALIAAVREVYSGRLVYAASWDEAEHVPFWDALDAVGVDAYFAVAGRRDASRLEMLAAWQPWLARLERLSRRTGREIQLTELGYMSRDGAGMNPPRFEGEEPLDLEEQADLYWAALTAVASAPRITGICIWNWPARAEGGVLDTDYTPRGKPAGEILRRAWSGDEAS